MGGFGKGKIPGVREDDVVDGFVSFSETGEADFEDHYVLVYGEYCCAPCILLEE